MSLQDIEEQIQKIESEFKEKFEKQRMDFESKYQNQQSEFIKKHQEIQSEFQTKYDLQRNEFETIYGKLESEFRQSITDLGKTTIDSVLNQESSKPKQTHAKIPFDKTIDPELYAAFDKKPYLIMPHEKKNSIYVYVPKFKGDFQVGWLKDTVDEYYRYEVNQFSILFGSVPDEILEEFDLPRPIKAKVVNDKITFDPKDKQFIKRELYRFVVDWTDSSARITKGHEFDIIDQILQSGYIPFEEKPVEKNHLISGNNIKLREYQKPVWTNFLKCGAVGVFHATGSGKSYIGMKGLENIKVENRKNLILSTKRAHLDQWEMYVEKEIPDALDNIIFSTYQGFKNYHEEFGLTIYDECRSLPARTFSRLATINTEYRMGMDATPYREDGQNHLIAALTGYAQNMNWPKYMKEYGPGYHPIFVHLVHNQLGKIHKGKSLFNPKKRTMIYSYHLPIGQQIADKLNLPFIHGETENKLEVAKSNHSFVASSVFTDGVSFEDLEQIIEIDFQFGSRQEEMQLSGRLMHSKAKNKAHHIIMTENEYDDYGKRLLSLQGNGFHVKIMENEN